MTMVCGNRQKKKKAIGLTGPYLASVAAALPPGAVQDRFAHLGLGRRRRLAEHRLLHDVLRLISNFEAIRAIASDHHKI